MSIVRIFFNPLDAKSKVEYPIKPGTQIIDFLQQEYSCGFDGVLRVFVGIQEIAIDDLDYVVQDDEQITMLVMPGITFALIGQYFLQALIAFAIGYVINLIFGPEVPGAPNAGEESSVYSLSPTRNSARLGEPIEVIYGTVSYPPSFASVPYAFFSGDSNDQFVDELLCLGQGYFENITITIGDTPVSILSPGTVQYFIYGPDDHNSTAGVIEADIAAKVTGTSVPFPFWENCFTSPEVDNYEFDQSVTDVQVLAPFAANAFAQTTNAAGGVILGRFDNVNSSLDLHVGNIITLSGTTLNNKTFTIGSITRNEGAGTMTIFQKLGDTNQIVNESPLAPTPQYLLNVTTNGQIAGPFRTQKLGQPINRVICDFIFPQGIYDIDGTDGDINQSYVTLGISVQQIDEDTDLPIGAPVEVQKTTYGRSTTPVRTSIDSGLLPEGAYEVTVEYLAGWGGQRTTGEASLVGVRGIVVLDTTPGATYGPVTLLAIRMKATQGLAGAARSRIRVKATRVLDPLTPTMLGSNPMTAIKDVWTNTEYGLGRTLAELDPHITAVEAEWLNGPFVNGAFDQRGTGYEAMGRIAAAVAGKVVNNGGLTDVVLERSQSARVALFNAATIIKDSLGVIYNFDTNGDYDGIEAAYSDADTFEARYAYYPETPLPMYPDTYSLWGVTDPVYAGQMARYLQNVKANRRKLVRFETELDGWLVAFGDRIGVSFPLANWGESGVIVQLIDPTTVRVDKNLNWTASNVVMLRDDQGKPNGPYPVTQGATPNIVIFAVTPTIPLYDMDAREPSNYVFGIDTQMVKDFVVSRVTPKGGTRFDIEAQTYSEAIYIGAPPHMTGGNAGTFCLTYNPNAYAEYFDKFAGTGANMWIMDMLFGNAVNYYPGKADMEYYLSSAYAQTTMIDDNRASVQVGGGSGFWQGPGPGYGQDLGGTIHLLHNPVGSISAGIWTVSLGTLVMRLSVSATNLILEFEGDSFTFSGALSGPKLGCLAGHHILVNYQMAYQIIDPGDDIATLSYDLYVDFVPLVIGGQLFMQNGSVAPGNVRLDWGASGGTAGNAQKLQYCFWTPTTLDSSEIPMMKAALLRNCKSYRDPTYPACTLNAYYYQAYQDAIKTHCQELWLCFDGTATQAAPYNLVNSINAANTLGMVSSPCTMKQTHTNLIDDIGAFEVWTSIQQWSSGGTSPPANWITSLSGAVGFVGKARNTSGEAGPILDMRWNATQKVQIRKAASSAGQCELLVYITVPTNSKTYSTGVFIPSTSSNVIEPNIILAWTMDGATGAFDLRLYKDFALSWGAAGTLSQTVAIASPFFRLGPAANAQGDNSWAYVWYRDSETDQTVIDALALGWEQNKLNYVP